MKQVFDQLLKFLQQGIAAIFHFVELIWAWSVDQISKLLAVPWHDWPPWKQVLLVLILAGVLWALYRAGRELLEAGVAILVAFGALLSVLVQTLPHVFLAVLSRLGACGLSTTWTMRPCECRTGCRPANKTTHHKIARITLTRTSDFRIDPARDASTLQRSRPG